jgi:hypothetical protein
VAADLKEVVAQTQLAHHTAALSPLNDSMVTNLDVEQDLRSQWQQ